MDGLIELKKKYNALLVRNSKAETYLNAHSYEECAIPLRNKKGEYLKQPNGDFINSFSVFDDLVAELSKTKQEIEVLIYRNMIHEEIINGFK